MTNKADYAVRIAEASPVGLVVINFELLIETIGEAKSLVGDAKKFSDKIDHSREFLYELVTSLDFSYSLATELFDLYMYVNKMLIKAKIKNATAPLDDSVVVLKNLMQGFETIAKSQPKEAVMSNAQQIVAGFTYSKSNLNESVVQNSGRGFKA